MPTSLGGLVLFVVLLTPGCIYLTRRESIRSTRRPSVLRETALVVCWSVVSCIAALLLFAIARALLPHATPDVGRLVRDRSRLRQVWQSTSIAAGVIVGLACGFAAIAGRPPKPVRGIFRRTRLDKMPPFRQWLSETDAEPIIRSSGWSEAFVPTETGAFVHVGIELVDGTYIEGYLYRFNPDEEDSMDRSLVLAWPLAIRRQDSSTLKPLEKDRLVVAAAMIRFMTVTFTSAAAPSPSLSIPSRPRRQHTVSRRRSSAAAPTGAP